MPRERIPAERPDGIVNVATVPEGWLVDDAWRPGETWLSPILEADPEVWAERLTRIAADVQMQLAERNNAAKVDPMSREAVDAYHQWRTRALALMRKVQGRARYASMLRKQVRVATAMDDTRRHVLDLRDAIKAHKAASEGGDFEAEAHDLALWALVESL